MISENKIAVYVSSFDGYSDLWKTYFEIFDRYWPDCTYKRYLVTNNADFNYNNVEVLKSGDEIDWKTRTLKTLKMISADYVLFTLEDYYFSKKILNEDIEEIIEKMSRSGIYYYQLSLAPAVRKKYIKYRSIKVSVKKNYPISLQLAIWNRKKFIEILEKIDNGSPWDFEHYFQVVELENDGRYIYGIGYDTRDLFGYKNGVLRGKWIPETVNYYRKKGFEIDTSKRGMVPLKKIIEWKLAGFISNNVNEKNKRIVKTLMKKMHIKYL